MHSVLFHVTLRSDCLIFRNIVQFNTVIKDPLLNLIKMYTVWIEIHSKHSFFLISGHLFSIPGSSNSR